jgi:hypothetical protein
MPASAAQAGMSAAPEKLLNRFVHLVASMERVGNALGTLAFTWATVVLATRSSSSACLCGSRQP